MFKGNYHTHTLFCDGSNTAEEMVSQALSLGFTHLGFSGHMDPDIRMDLPAYYSEVCRLRDIYRDQIDILCGVERDTLYVPQTQEESEIFKRLEFTIGSTHFIECADGSLFAVDDTPERLLNGCRMYFDGDPYRMAKAYYELEAQVCDRFPCTFIGHFDLITRFNDDLHFLDESDRRYYIPALEAMEYLVSKDIPFEINCGAVNRGRKAELYPNRFLLQNLHDLGGRILISSDAHQKNLLDGGFDTAARTARVCGFESVLYLAHDASGDVLWKEAALSDIINAGLQGADINH